MGAALAQFHDGSKDGQFAKIFCYGTNQIVRCVFVQDFGLMKHLEFLRGVFTCHNGWSARKLVTSYTFPFTISQQSFSVVCLATSSAVYSSMLRNCCRAGAFCVIVGHGLAWRPFEIDMAWNSQVFTVQMSSRSGTVKVMNRRVVKNGWKELMPDFRDHQLYASKYPTIYWPALFFPADRRLGLSYSKLCNHLRIAGRWYYGCCIAMLFLGFLNCMTRCDYTIPIVVIGMIAYWMNDVQQAHPNYFTREWPAYYHERRDGGKPLAEGFIHQKRIFYLRHCIVAAELFLLSLIFSIILDVLWIAVHGDYLRDYGALPINVDFSIKAIVQIHKFALGISICQLLLKLFSIYWIVWYIRFLCYILFYIVPPKGTARDQFKEPHPPFKEIPKPKEPPPPEQNIPEPSVADL